MTKLQLYIKEGNRYKPYEPQEHYDKALYKKYIKPNGKAEYVDVGMSINNDSLGEGVWVVYKTRCCKGYTREERMRTEYRLSHVSNLQNPLLKLNTSQLGAVNKIMEEAYFKHSEDHRSDIDIFKIACAEVIYELTKTKI